MIMELPSSDGGGNVDASNKIESENADGNIFILYAIWQSWVTKHFANLVWLTFYLIH